MTGIQRQRKESKMPRRRTPKIDSVINMVLESQKIEKEALRRYREAQDHHLETLRKARQMGETCENLADALNVSKQWVYKYTAYGRDHNKATSKAQQQFHEKPSFSKWG